MNWPERFNQFLAEIRWGDVASALAALFEPGSTRGLVGRLTRPLASSTRSAMRIGAEIHADQFGLVGRGEAHLRLHAAYAVELVGSGGDVPCLALYGPCETRAIPSVVPAFPMRRY